MKFLAIIAIGATLLLSAVDINNASKEELMILKGLGDKKAAAVLDYRKEHCFKTVESMTEVKGIGPKFVEKNKKNLTAGKCKK